MEKANKYIELLTEKKEFLSTSVDFSKLCSIIGRFATISAGKTPNTKSIVDEYKLRFIKEEASLDGKKKRKIFYKDEPIGTKEVSIKGSDEKKTVKIETKTIYNYVSDFKVSLYVILIYFASNPESELSKFISSHKEDIFIDLETVIDKEDVKLECNEKTDFNRIYSESSSKFSQKINSLLIYIGVNSNYGKDAKCFYNFCYRLISVMAKKKYLWGNKAAYGADSLFSTLIAINDNLFDDLVQIKEIYSNVSKDIKERTKTKSKKPKEEVVKEEPKKLLFGDEDEDEGEGEGEGEGEAENDD